MKTIDKPKLRKIKVKKSESGLRVDDVKEAIENTQKLKFVRIFDPIHIPKYLVEQIKQRDYDIDDFYSYQKQSNIVIEDGKTNLNPLNHLYVLVNDENEVKGFAWFTINPLSKSLFINNFSMNKDYWHKGKAIEQLKDYVVKVMKKAKLKQILWHTNYPKHFEKYGFKKSKSILMEYDNG